MAGNVANIKVCNPLKLHSGLTGNYHAICHYSYNLPLCFIRAADVKNSHDYEILIKCFFEIIENKEKCPLRHLSLSLYGRLPLKLASGRKQRLQRL